MNTRKYTCSPASGVGRSHCVSPGGRRTARCGREAAHVSRSQSRGSAEAKKTPATSGRKCGGSSASAALQSSLESRLRALLDVDGSPEYALTWKTWDMPSGAPICALRASARRTSGNGCTGWPTPCSQDGPKGGPSQGADRLPAAAHLAGWPTATSRDWKDGDCRGANVLPNGLLGRVALLAGWPSPKARDRGRVARRRKSTGGNANLDERAHEWLAGWATPTTDDRPSKRKGRNVAMPASGLSRESLNASTAVPAGYRLNPHFSRWLMGFPAEWLSCVDWATRSFRKSRRRS